MKKKLILLITTFLVLITSIVVVIHKNNQSEVIKNNNETDTKGLISVLVDGVEQSAFPSKGSAEYQSTSCTNGETAVWDETNWKLSIQDISASTRCVVSFATGGHNVYVSVSGGTVDSAPKQVAHNGNVTFTVAASNTNYVFSSAKCSGANGYSWANNILSVNGVIADAYCDVVFSRPVYTVYFTVVGGYTESNYLTVVRGGTNSTTFGSIAGYLTSGATITCDTGITGKLAGTRVVISNVLASGDCTITNSKDTSNYLPGGASYNVGDEVSYANLAWLVVSSDEDTVTLILKSNATYDNESGSNVTGTGVYGSGVTFTSSSARSYLQDIWLEQTQQKYLKSAIDSSALEYQEDANGYVRLPYISEVNTKLPNASGTNFWTMDNDGNGHVYYGQPNGYGTEGKNSDGKYYFEYYVISPTNSVQYQWTSTLKKTGVSTVTYFFWNANGVSRNLWYYNSTWNLHYSSNYGTGWAYTASSLTSKATAYTYGINIYAYLTCGYDGVEEVGKYLTAGTNAYLYVTYLPYGHVQFYNNTKWYVTNNTTFTPQQVNVGAHLTNGGNYVQQVTGYNYSYLNGANYSYQPTWFYAPYAYQVCTQWPLKSATLTCSTTVKQTLNPYSGTNTWAAGQYGAGYRKYVAGSVSVSDTNSSTATKNTALSYNSTTAGNSSMTSGVQAVLPTSTSARTNDSAPTSADVTISSPTESGSCTGTGTGNMWGYNVWTSENTQTFYHTKGDTYESITHYATGVKAKNQTLSLSNSSSTTNKTYKKYTLSTYNTSTMGYRPVIVVKKAN